MARDEKIQVTFVCLGNICRSPIAEAIFRNLVAKANLSERIQVASAATSRWELGERPHPGTQAVLRRHGVPLDPNKRAEIITREGFENSDYVIVMDTGNAADLSRFGKVRRLMEFAPRGMPLDVPDPYYDHNFDNVYELIDAGCRGLLDYLRKKEHL
jgi:protein-tyrosine phosphatase